MSDYDAVVVGAGPGGSAAAYYLASTGAKVLVIEKKQFPRPKTCGDGLTPRAIKVLDDMGLGSCLDKYQRVRGLRVLAHGHTLEMEFPKGKGYPHFGLVRPRRDLDQEVAEHARRRGAQYRFQTEASEPIWQEGSLIGVRWVRKEKAPGGGVIKVDEGEVRAPFTIIADGASSPFGRALGIARDPSYPLGLAIRTYYESDRGDDELFESWLELRKGDTLLPGYGWIFPVGDGTVNIGVGLLTTFGPWRSVNLNHLQRDYIDMLPPSYGITHENQTEPYRSGRLPMGGSVRKPFGKGYLLIGDAAGFVNPFNGEGIAYALETSKIAAGVIAEALARGSDTEPVAYREALNDIYGGYYRIARKFTKIIGHPAAFQALCQVGMRSQTIMEFVFLVLANLGKARGGGLGDRTLRSMSKLAQQDLSKLVDPDISAPLGTKTLETKGAA